MGIFCGKMFFMEKMFDGRGRRPNLWQKLMRKVSVYLAENKLLKIFEFHQPLKLKKQILQNNFDTEMFIFCNFFKQYY